MPPEAAEAQENTDVLEVVVDDPPGNEPDAGAPEAGNDDAPQSSEEAVKLASLMGWKPKDQWKGDDKGWKSAEDFVAEIPEILSKTRQRASKTQAQLDQVAGLVAKLDKNQRNALDAKLDADLEAAVEAGDADAARKVMAQIKAVNQKTDTDPPALSSFKERNAEWFEVDPEATAYAMALDAQYAKGGISDPQTHMLRVEAGVKKKFPEHFGAVEDKPKDERQTRRAPLVGAPSGGSRPARPNGEVTVADLTPSQRRGAETSGVSLADYAKAVTKMNQMARRA